MLEQTIKITALYDFYGVLLTQRQQKCIEMHYFDDLSLAEVAEHFCTSRQAVHDILKRSVQTMNNFEQKLRLIDKHKKEQDLLAEIDELLVKSQIKIPELVRVREKILQLLI